MRNKLNEIINNFEKFRLSGPSDDPDEQTDTIYGYKDLLKSFLYYAKKLHYDDLKETINRINPEEIETIYNVYDVSSEVNPVIQELKDIFSCEDKIDSLIGEIKAIMTEVATRKKNIQDINEEYKTKYQELNAIYKKLKLKNPNPFEDLWEFYNFWKEKNFTSYQERRNFIIKMYKTNSSVEFNYNENYVHEENIIKLKQIINSQYDLSKLIKYLEELNYNYKSENFISVSLLVRAVINHIPPIFGVTSFKEVVNSSPKSIKELLKPLEEGFRDIADMHTHNLIRKKETLPTRYQVEPFKANFEVLIQEIINKL